MSNEKKVRQQDAEPPWLQQILAESRQIHTESTEESRRLHNEATHESRRLHDEAMGPLDARWRADRRETDERFWALYRDLKESGERNTELLRMSHSPQLFSANRAAARAVASAA